MRFIDVRYKKFDFNLPVSINNSNQTISSKQIIIIKAIDEKGGVHFGEVGPLLGFSRENIIEVEEILEGLISNWKEYNLVDLKEWISSLSQYPSLKFGLEQILFSAERNEEHLSGKKVINANGLVGILNKEQTITEVKRLFDLGFDTIKLKIGRDNFYNDLSILQEIKNNFDEKIKLRLDNNGSWSFDDASENAELLSQFSIEYLEQPINKSEDLLNLAENTKILIAPDESISCYDDAIKFIDSGKFKQIVLKPTIRIGLFDTAKLIEYANIKGVRVIITSAYETAIARNTLLYLASITIHNYSHGLNTPILGEKSVISNFKNDMPKIPFNYKEMFNSISVSF